MHSPARSIQIPSQIEQGEGHPSRVIVGISALIGHFVALGRAVSMMLPICIRKSGKLTNYAIVAVDRSHAEGSRTRFASKYTWSKSEREHTSIALSQTTASQPVLGFNRCTAPPHGNVSDSQSSRAKSWHWVGQVKIESFTESGNKSRVVTQTDTLPCHSRGIR